MDERQADREFLFSYHFGGKQWGTSVFAADEAEAREKIKAVGMARYDGELMMRIPATVPGANMLTRAICWWRNTDHHKVGRLCAAAETFAASQGDMRAFGASDAACYKWPDDTPEHRALRAAYIEGAAACGSTLPPQGSGE